MVILQVRQRWRWLWAAGLAAIGLALIAGVWLFTAEPGDRGAGALIPPAANPVANTPGRTAVATHPPAAATAAASSRPLSRLDFDSAEDLYALATSAANSNDLMTLHNGRHATLSCISTPQTRAQYEALVATGRGDATSEERKRAAAVVLRKCAGFFNNDFAANDALRRRLRDGLLAHAGEYIIGLSQGPPTDKQMIAAIERGDWQTFSGAFGEIWPRVWARAGIEPKSEDALLFGVASLQALCELGQDCSPNGLAYTIQCALHAEMCAGSWQSFHLRDISAEQAVKVRRFRNEIVDAYRRKDAAYFGLIP